MYRALLTSITSLFCAAIAGADVQFFPPSEFELSGSEPRQIVAADLNGDASPDLIVSMSADGEMSYLFGSPSGGFPESDSLQTGISAWGVGVSDFNGDGFDDFAVSDGTGAGAAVKIYLNDTEGGFNAGPQLTAGSFPLAIIAADLDGDDDADLAVANNVLHGLSIFLNDGDGASFTFLGHVPGLTNAHATDLAAGDFDGDQDLDLALAHYDGVHICTNDGNAGFTVTGSAGYAIGTTHAVDVGDVDNDGVLDVASCQIYSGSIAVRLGNGDGTFGAPILLSIGASAEDVIIVDITGEGRDDIVGINQDTDRVYVFESLGGGAFAPSESFIVGERPAVVIAEDFDEDGDPDLAIPCRNLGETPFLSVLLNDQVAPLCIEVLEQPGENVARWSGHIAAFETLVVGEPPITYEWFKDGELLVDGPTGHGSTIAGSASDSLVVEHLTPDDAGGYSMTATCPCGSASAGPFMLEIRIPPDLPSSWTVTNLHPAGALGSVGHAIDAFGQYGSITVFHDELGINVTNPGRWEGTPDSFVNLTPPDSAGGTILDSVGGVQVGWWWWPYPCGTGLTCYSKQAARWAGTPESFDNLQVSGWEYSQANATDGEIHVGTKSTDDEVGNTFAHAVIWTPPNYTSVDLHPPGTIASKSFGSAIDNGHQYGSYHTPFPGPVVKAAMWTGSAESFADLHPPGAASSWIYCAGDGQQAGRAEFGADQQVGIWADSPLTFLPLAPGCGFGCSLNDCAGGLQAGVRLGHATLWASSADLAVDLHDALPADFTASIAQAIWIDPEGPIHVVGSAYNATAERTEAILWTADAGAECPADVDGSGAVNVLDLLILLENWGPCPGCVADLDGDDAVNVLDLLQLLAAWGPC
jgi:hypothetical protein